MIQQLKFFPLLTIMLSTLAFSSCSDDEILCPDTATLSGDKCLDNKTGLEVEPVKDTDCGSDLCAENLPKLETDVTQLVFSSVVLGETGVTSVLLINSGKGVLKVSGIKLVENTKDDEGGNEFSKGEDWIESFELKQDETREISVKYTPKDTSPDDGFIEVISNDSKNPNLQLEILSQDLDARVFSKPTISFARVAPVNEMTRNKSWQLSSIQNVGEAPLKIEDIIISPNDSDFSITFPATDDATADPADDTKNWPAAALKANEKFPIRVYFNPDTPDPTEAELHILSNDSNSPDYTVSLVGNSDEACLEVVTGEDEINFGEGGIGFANNKTITIKNCSQGKDLKISDLGLCTNVGADCDPNSTIFELKNPLPAGIDTADGMVVGPQATVSFVAIYTPIDLAVSEGALSFNSDDPTKSSVIIPLKGKGTTNACPTAIADAQIRGTNRYQTMIATIPLKWIEFRGSNSTDADGTVDRYEWTIVSAPIDSNSRLSNTAVENPSLELDIAGEYVIELKVYDDKGTASCGDQSRITIVATPDEDISIELSWQTPNDNNENDANGADLDLHYLHPVGKWNASPRDIFYRNKTADWGIPGESDDPSLDRDDIDGLGPENLNHDNPENDIVYSVGVHYYADRSFGASYASIRIFIGGVKKFEELDRLLPSTGSFWYVANIAWPSRQISPRNIVQQGFPGATTP